MSDNVCPKCGKPYDTSGVCPCWRYNWDGTPYFYLPRPEVDAEIARLKAELKNGQELLGYALAEGDGLKAAIEQANIERDEARRWARYYRSKYEDTKKGNW